MTELREPLLEKVTRLFEGQAFGGYRVEDMDRMADGHAGHTFGLDLRDQAGETSRYILKMGPPGVPRRGSADIFRQTPLLKALHSQGLPVPNICWSSADEEELGAPFIVMSRLPGRSLIIWEPDPSFLDGRLVLPELWIAGARALARLHQVRHDIVLAGWEAPTSLLAEVDRWASLVRHSEDPEWQRLLHALGDALRDAMPPDDPVGLVHGDFQPGNILFHEGRIAGIIDWDLAAIGPQGIDVGWYLMMADAECWHPSWRPVTTAPKQDVLRAYEEAGGPALRHSAWYQAFAHFRFCAIAGLNLKLHRNGKREDPMWEKFAISVPFLLGSALDILKKKDAA
jgi:aminoglycoside phosphotransferase (APT) family kinase protein